MDYLKIANSSLAFILTSVILIAVLIQTFIFIRMGWKRALKLGLEKSTLIKAVKSGASVTVIPSLPIIISLIMLIPLLGVPVPWLRLSVIGSPMFEMFAADLGAKAAGAAGLGGEGFNSGAFISAAWVMTLGGCSSLAFCLIFLKPISMGYEKAKKRNPAWMIMFGTAALVGIMATNFVNYVGVDVIPSVVTILGFGGVILCNKLAKKYKFLKDYALTIGMLSGMIAAIILTPMI